MIGHASINRIVPWMDGHRAVARVWSDGPGRLSLWIDDVFVPIIDAPDHEIRGGYVILPGPTEEATVPFDFDYRQNGRASFVCRIDEPDIIDRIADLASRPSTVENLGHDREPPRHTEDRRPA